MYKNSRWKKNAITSSVRYEWSRHLMEFLWTFQSNSMQKYSYVQIVCHFKLKNCMTSVIYREQPRRKKKCWHSKRQLMCVVTLSKTKDYVHLLTIRCSCFHFISSHFECAKLPLCLIACKCYNKIISCLLCAHSRFMTVVISFRSIWTIRIGFFFISIPFSLHVSAWASEFADYGCG